MNTREFKVWLALNGYTQKSLAKKLQVSADTIGNYVKADRMPQRIEYALHGLSLMTLSNSEFEAIKHLLTPSQIKRIEIIEE